MLYGDNHYYNDIKHVMNDVVLYLIVLLFCI